MFGKRILTEHMIRERVEDKKKTRVSTRLKVGSRR